MKVYDTPIAFGFLAVTVGSIVLGLAISLAMGTTIGIASGLVMWFLGFSMVILPQLLMIRELKKPDNEKQFPKGVNHE